MIHWFCDFFAGWSGGIAGVIIGHPFDTIKVRQQVLPKGTTILPLIKSTYQIEGWRGFFKGMTYPLVGSGIYNAILFGVYGNCLRLLQGSQQKPRKMCCEGDAPNSSWHRHVFISGCVGGAFTVIYSCPLEVIKTKLQVQTVAVPSASVSVCKKICRTEPYYNNSFDAFLKIYSNYGVFRGLYRGCLCMFWRDVPTFGLYMLVYEHLLCATRDPNDRSPNTTLGGQILAGSIAGFLSWVTVAPLDVIKSRLQADDIGRPIYKGITDCFRKIILQDGTKSLFSGLSLACIRSIPVNAITFVVYEFNLRMCEKWF